MMLKYLHLVKFSHTIFALPFAIVGFLLGYLQLNGDVSWLTFLFVIACMVFARNTAMAFNRWADRKIDAENPRTAQREIPSGKLEARKVLFFVIANALLFMLSAKLISNICFFLSPIALMIILGYSYAKRFTSIAHIILGLGLSLAPIGAYIAVIGKTDIIPMLFGAVVLFWVSGFDIIYAIQDEQFDKDTQLHSIPSKFGEKQSLMIALCFHTACVALIWFATYLTILDYDQMKGLSILGSIIFTFSVVYQHWVIRPFDIDKIDLAFFRSNGVASLAFGICFVLDVFLR